VSLPEFQMSGIVGLGTSLHPVSVYCTFHKHCLIMDMSHVTWGITAAHLGRSIFAWHPSQGPLFQTSMESRDNLALSIHNDALYLLFTPRPLCFFWIWHDACRLFQHSCQGHVCQVFTHMHYGVCGGRSLKMFKNV
jgi:hypothetical protein